MSIKPAWKYTILAAGISLTAIMTLLPLIKTKPDCLASEGQTVVRWKDMYYGYGTCQRSWNEYCLWPLRRPHSTYKVTVNEGIPVRNENGRIIPIAGGKIRRWEVYDSIAWNRLGDKHPRWMTFSDYEPIAANEYVVLVETRYRLFHNVEATLRICTQQPGS